MGFGQRLAPFGSGSIPRRLARQGLLQPTLLIAPYRTLLNPLFEAR